VTAELRTAPPDGDKEFKSNDGSFESHAIYHATNYEVEVIVTARKTWNFNGANVTDDAGADVAFDIGCDPSNGELSVEEGGDTNRWLAWSGTVVHQAVAYISLPPQETWGGGWDRKSHHQLTLKFNGLEATSEKGIKQPNTVKGRWPEPWSWQVVDKQSVSFSFTWWSVLREA